MFWGIGRLRLRRMVADPPVQTLDEGLAGPALKWFYLCGNDPETGLEGYRATGARCRILRGDFRFAGAASAADLPTRAPLVPVRSAPDWSGFYGGVNIGYGFGRTTNLPGVTEGKVEGLLGGVQAGGQWQAGMFVFGVEADIQGSFQKHDYVATLAGTTVSVKEETPWFGTARLRAGVAFDRVLLYVTGGGAYINLKVSGAAGGPVLADKVTHAAWTGGGGVEVLLSERWSGKVEICISTPET